MINIGNWGGALISRPTQGPTRRAAAAPFLAHPFLAALGCEGLQSRPWANGSAFGNQRWQWEIPKLNGSFHGKIICINKNYVCCLSRALHCNPVPPSCKQSTCGKRICSLFNFLLFNCKKVRLSFSR